MELSSSQLSAYGGGRATPKMPWPSEEKWFENFRKSGLGEVESRKRAEEKTEERFKIKALSQEFEAQFVAMLLNEMKKTVDKNEMFHGGFGEEVFDSLLSMEQARDITTKGAGVGLAEQVEQDMIRNITARMKFSHSPADQGSTKIRSPYDSGVTKDGRALNAPVGSMDKVRSAMALARRQLSYGGK